MNIKKIRGMNKSITFKILVITLTFFMVFTTCIFVFETLFFEKFYTSWKMNTLEKNALSFEEDYNKTTSDDESSKLIADFQDNNNSRVGILDKNGYLKPFGSNERELSFNERVIGNALNQLLATPGALVDMKRSGKVKSYIFQNGNSNNKTSHMKTIVSVLPDQHNNELIFVVSSLQPVSEAALVMQEIFIYIYIAAFIITILLSIIYSNMISKPLIKLNKTASRMSDFDFTEKYLVNSEDEIGNLGATLNFLSENLDRSLKSLKAANLKLKMDIERERNVEKMRREFVGGISHELKTPISLIEGYAEGIKDDVFEGEDKNYYVDVIIDEAKKMGLLVADMLDLAQLENGNFKLKSQGFYIDKLINVTVKKYYNIFNNKKIDVQLNIAKEVLVFGDTMRIEQVLTNFITNAIRHTEENGSIEILMKKDEEKVYIYVKNSGKSIEKENLTKIWDKFFKIDKSRNRELGGTGLGLAITKNILILHKSDFGVENYEEGVSFYFSLNLVKK
jgi:two-component system sensor histidine kinase VanS